MQFQQMVVFIGAGNDFAMSLDEAAKLASVVSCEQLYCCSFVHYTCITLICSKFHHQQECTHSE